MSAYVEEGYNYQVITTVEVRDGGVVENTYGQVYNLTKVQDPEKGVYTYIYDDTDRPVEMIYPNGWIEAYAYDAESNLIKTMDTAPFPVVKKTTTKFEYRYDEIRNQF